MTISKDLYEGFEINNLLFVDLEQSANPPFSGIELDHSDSGREGCAVSTLTITAEPKHWEGAIRVGVQEVSSLQVNCKELTSLGLLVHNFVLTR